MPFTKIQPQQLQLPTFTSPSGDFSFSDLSTGFQINLSRDIDGPINFNTEVTVDNNALLTTSSTNSFSSSSIALGGEGNVVSGSNNVLVNGLNNTDISGSYNVLVNGTQVDFGASGQNNTILAGKSSSFSDQITGSVILADHETTVTNDTNQSLVISFESGINFRNGDVKFENGDAIFESDAYFSGNDAYFDTHLRVNQNHSGIFSGNIKVGGTAYFNNDVTVVAPMTVTNSLTLPDSSEAASKAYIDERVGFSLTESSESALTTALGGVGYGDVIPTDLKNVLTGTAAGSDIFTGHLFTGSNVGTTEAYFVLQGANFTGALKFTTDSFTVI